MQTTAPTSGTFDRLKAQGLSLFRSGKFAEAKPVLAQAAECLLAMAEQSKSDAVRDGRCDAAQQLIALTKKCDELRDKPAASKRAARNDDGDGGGSADDWVVRERPDVSFDDIAGLEAVKEEIRLKMIWPLRFPAEAKEYRLSVGGGLLLYGPPGTGKTMIAKAIAREIDATFFTVSSADILSKWVGEAEQNVRKLFDAARAEPKAVIFIDEIEALVPRRSSGGSTVMQRVVPQMLQELEGFDRKGDQCLLFVGATNKPWMLDDAMLRPGRFDTRVYLDLPDPPARTRMLEIYLAGRPLGGDIDLAKLCGMLDGYSGADIKSVCDRAASIPFMGFVQSGGGEGEKRPVSMADMEAALSEVRPSVLSKDLARYKKFAETGS
jgi:transitional endoplasmic reticulum ATPase